LAAAPFWGVVARFAEDAFALLDDARGRGAFFAEDAVRFAVAAAFFTGAAFFWSERFSRATDTADDLFPPAVFLATADRDPGAFLGGAPLRAGVIVSSS
jgi:TRAP-type C4-dicarboxylate transport system permease small subunit